MKSSWRLEQQHQLSSSIDDRTRAQVGTGNDIILGDLTGTREGNTPRRAGGWR